MNTVFVIPLLILSGFFADPSSFAPFLYPFEFISYFKFGYQTILHLEFTDTQPLNCINMDPVGCNPVPQRFVFESNFALSIGATSLLIVFFYAVAFFVILKLSKIKV